MKRLTGFLLAGVCLIPPVIAGGFSVHETASTIEVRDNGQLVAVLHTDTTSSEKHPARFQYIHPFMAFGGEVMTEDMPPDHVHQRGIYWAWRQIKWRGEQLANSWTLENIRFEPKSRAYEINNKGQAVIGSDIIWHVPHETAWKPIVHEQTVVRFASLSHNRRQLHIQVTLTVLVDGVEIGGAPNSKGYGGISARFKDGPAMRFFERDGHEIIPTSDPVQTNGPIVMRWDTSSSLAPYELSMSCSYDGQDIRWWILRRGLSMQNCVWPGRRPVPLLVSKPVRLEAEVTVSRVGVLLPSK